MVVEHLGDGVYVTINRDFVGHVILTANHHDPQQATDVVHLDYDSVKLLTELIAKAQESNDV